MDLEKTMKSLKKNRYEVSYFATAKEAAEYLDRQIDQKTVGFGDSRTLIDMKMYDMLAAHNQVFDPNQGANATGKEDEFAAVGKRCLTTDIFLTSVNAISETGEMVNIDGTGNRVAGSLFGHEKVYFVAGINKIEPTLDQAIWRARNVAGPLDAIKYNLNTPCVRGEHHCYDCYSEERICNAMVIYMKKMEYTDAEVVLIGESMGF